MTRIGSHANRNGTQRARWVRIGVWCVAAGLMGGALGWLRPSTARGVCDELVVAIEVINSTDGRVRSAYGSDSGTDSGDSGGPCASTSRPEFAWYEALPGGIQAGPSGEYWLRICSQHYSTMFLSPRSAD